MARNINPETAEFKIFGSVPNLDALSYLKELMLKQFNMMLDSCLTLLYSRSHFCHWSKCFALEGNLITKRPTLGTCV